jgi:glycosyltransferase involved in cell wall biosynthesis
VDRPSLTIVVPALNEEKHLPFSVGEALQAASESGVSCEVIVVDDGSTDRTGDVARELAEADARISVIRNARNMGLGGAYKAGLAAAKGTHITWVPADASHPAPGLVPAYRSIGQADIIIPRPTNPEVRGKGRRVVSALYTRLVNAFNGLDVPYYNGLSVHRVDLLRSIPLRTDSFGFQAEAITRLLLRGASYKVVDTYITERQLGRTKAFRVKNVLAVVRTLARILRLSLWQKVSGGPSAEARPPESKPAEPQSRK